MLEIDAEQRLGAFRLDIHMRAPSRGVIALFGISGTGKTSLVNMLSCLTRPTRGRIVIDDTVLFDSTGWTSVPPERRRLGYVFQEDRCFASERARNLLYGHRRAPARRTTTIAEIVELLGIGHLLTGDRPASRAARSSASRSAVRCSPIRAAADG
jgi:molybdate transport system ATP-binding protein